MTLPMREMPRFPVLIDGQSNHDYLAACREISPVMRDRFGIVTTFSMAQFTNLLDDRWTRQVETEGLRVSGVTGGTTFEFLKQVLLFSNGQAHRNRRAPLARTFAQPLMVAMRPEVAARVDRLVSPLIGKGPVPFIEALAGPLPAMTIASIIGAPESDSAKFSELAYTASRAIGICTPAERKKADAALVELSAYVSDLLDDRRANPQDDFLTTYLEKVTGGPLSADEIRAQIVGLVVAGSDTTRGSLTSTVSQLLQHPSQWALLVEDPDKHAPGAVSEGLRFDPIIGSLARITLQEIEIEGYAIPQNALVTPSMLMAMRDPAVYADPDTFDITRADHPRHHPIFGAGPHRCIGEVLARIELEEALKALARKAPGMRLDGQPAKLKGFSATRSIPEMHVIM